MAIKTVIGFAVRVIGDGSDDDISIPINTSPLGLRIPFVSDATYELPPAFVLSLLTPTAVKNVASGNNHSIASVSLSLGAIVVTYDDPLPLNEIDVLYGDIVF